MYYKLENNKPVPVEDVKQWGGNVEDRTVKKTWIGEIEVSTVFLGLDHSWGGAVPILFETMIFGDPKFEDYQERYATWEEAETGHQKAVEFIERRENETKRPSD